MVGAMDSTCSYNVGKSENGRAVEYLTAVVLVLQNWQIEDRYIVDCSSCWNDKSDQRIEERHSIWQPVVNQRQDVSSVVARRSLSCRDERQMYSDRSYMMVTPDFETDLVVGFDYNLVDSTERLAPVEDEKPCYRHYQYQTALDQGLGCHLESRQNLARH